MIDLNLIYELLSTLVGFLGVYLGKTAHNKVDKLCNTCANAPYEEKLKEGDLTPILPFAK